MLACLLRMRRSSDWMLFRHAWRRLRFRREFKAATARGRMWP